MKMYVEVVGLHERSALFPHPRLYSLYTLNRKSVWKFNTDVQSSLHLPAFETRIFEPVALFIYELRYNRKGISWIAEGWLNTRVSTTKSAISTSATILTRLWEGSNHSVKWLFTGRTDGVRSPVPRILHFSSSSCPAWLWGPKKPSVLWVAEALCQKRIGARSHDHNSPSTSEVMNV
jgi:hypothetical protein